MKKALLAASLCLVACNDTKYPKTIPTADSTLTMDEAQPPKEKRIGVVLIYPVADSLSNIERLVHDQENGSWVYDIDDSQQSSFNLREHVYVHVVKKKKYTRIATVVPKSAWMDIGRDVFLEGYVDYIRTEKTHDE